LPSGHLAPLQPVNAAAPGARCRRCVQGRLFAHRVCVCGRPTGRGTKPGIRLAVSGQVSAHMSGPGRNCPVPTENWLRPSAACLRGTCLYHRASVPPWPELAQTFPSGAAPRHAHPRVAALLLRLACHSGPCSPLASSKQQQHDHSHYLTLQQESHLLSQKIIRSSSAILPTTLLPDKPRLSAKSCLIQSCALLQTLVSVTQS
jgi:hypothetical protein